MGLIYGIHCRIEMDDIYVGSSEDERTYEVRQTSHKSKQNKSSSKIIIDRGDYYFQIIEENDLQDDELRKREQYWIEKCNAINHNRAYVSEEEKEEYNKLWYEKNRQAKLEYQREYNEKNKEKIKEYFKEYNETHKEKIKERSKEYYENHKEAMREYLREYNEKHKEAIREYNKLRYEKHKEKLNNGVQTRYAYKCSMGGLSDIKMDLFH